MARSKEDDWGLLKRMGLMKAYQAERDKLVEAGVQKAKANLQIKKKYVEIARKKDLEELAEERDTNQSLADLTGVDADYTPTQEDLGWALANASRTKVDPKDAPSPFAFGLHDKMQGPKGNDVYKMALGMITPKTFVDDRPRDINHDDGRSLTRIAEKLKAAFNARPELQAS